MNTLNDHTPETPRVFNTPAAAALLGVRPQTLAKGRCTGELKLKFVKIGRRVVYRESDILAFLAENLVTP